MSDMYRLSIKQKLILSFFLIVFISTTVFCLVLGITSRNRSLSDFTRSTERELRQVGNAMWILISETKANVRMLARHPLMRELDESLINYTRTEQPSNLSPPEAGGLNAKLWQILNRMCKAHGDYAEIFLGTSHGGFISSVLTPQKPGYDPRVRPWYRKALARPGQVVLSAAYLSTTGSPVVSLVQTVQDRAGDIAGVVGIDFNLDRLSRIIRDIRIGRTGYVMLVQHDGTVLASPRNTAFNFEKISDLKIRGADILARTNSGCTEVTIDGTTYIATLFTSSQTGWKLIGMIEQSEIMAYYHSVLRQIIVVGGGLLVLFTGVAILMATSVSAPVRRIAASLSHEARKVASAAASVSRTSHSLAAGASEQAASVEQISSALNENADITRQSAENVRQANELTRKVHRMTAEAAQFMKALRLSMKAISESGHQSLGIVRTIDGIAFQIRLLALNAAVEAARSGDTGAGFAVVAEEVRRLATHTADAARTTAELINEGVEIIDESSEGVARTNDAFMRVSRNVSDVGQLIAEIAGASEQQALGISQIANAVGEVNAVIHQNAAQADDSAEAAEALHGRSDRINATTEALINIVEGRKRHGLKTDGAPGLIPAGG